MRQCGEDVLRMLVTGGPPVRGGGGMPQRTVTNSRPVCGKTPGIGGRLPTYRLMTLNSAMMAAWFVVML